MPTLHVALLAPYVSVRVALGALVAHRYTYAPCSRCRTSQYRRTLILISVSLFNDLTHPAFDGMGPAGLMTRANAFFIGFICSLPCCLLLCSISLLYFCRLYCGAGVFRLIGCKSLFPNLALPTCNKNLNNNCY